MSVSVAGWALSSPASTARPQSSQISSYSGNCTFDLQKDKVLFSVFDFTIPDRSCQPGNRNIESAAMISHNSSRIVRLGLGIPPKSSVCGLSRAC